MLAWGRSRVHLAYAPEGYCKHQEKRAWCPLMSNPCCPTQVAGLYSQVTSEGRRLLSHGAPFPCQVHYLKKCVFKCLGLPATN